MIIYPIFLIIKILGINIGRKISTFLFLKVGSLFRSNENIKKNISHAYENLTEDEKNNIINDMWINYGLTFAEYLFMAKFRKNKFSKAQISINGKDILEDVCDNLFNPDPFFQQGGDMVRVGGMSYRCSPKAEMGNRISDMVLTRTGTPIEAERRYTVGGWASIDPNTEGPAIYDLLESYITKKGVVTPSGEQSVIVEGMD